MPYISKWIANELFLEHNGIRIFHTYKNDDDIILDYWFGTASDSSVFGDETFFDVRELPTWKGHKDRGSMDAARRSAIIAAIERGHLDKYIDAADGRDKDVPDGDKDNGQEWLRIRFCPASRP